ncbi:hypothetical protein [Sphingosinicella xenopeptidilytica]|uniref:Uncharacterized protein n=1 Tax=Sphingosinicella xenopeptidilytica TaxID=364098 RepID=A0ABW3C9M9_SPHXN
MIERGPSLVEIIGVKLASLFRARPRRRALLPVLAQPAPRALHSVPVATPCAADDRLIAAYRDLLRMPA